MNCRDARQIDIVSFLKKNGYSSECVQGVNHWYKSPLRNENNPSFKVNSYKNLWFDFGLGEGGDIIKLVCLLFKINSSKALQLLSCGYQIHSEIQNVEESKVLITSAKEISSIQLVNYIKARKLDLYFVKKYCKEVSFILKGKNYYSLGFENNSKGFELRNKYFKGSSTPKDITLIRNETDNLLVFEGFIDFLSWFSSRFFSPVQYDYLILNTLSFLGKGKVIIGEYQNVLLFLDNDEAGECATAELMAIKGCVDMSKRYAEVKDLNDFIINGG